MPLGGGRAPARGALLVARQLAPIASAVILALIAVLLGIVVRQGEAPVAHKPSHCPISGPVIKPPTFAPHTPVLLSNGLVWLGAATGMQADTDVLLVGGKIAQVRPLRLLVSSTRGESSLRLISERYIIPHFSFLTY